MFTKYGFYSIAQADARVGGSGDDLMVRARMREHLEAIQNRFPGMIGKLKIIEISEADYGYRLVVRRSIWAQIASELTMEQTWSNFKNEVASNPDNIRSGYEGALHRIWTIMYGLQPQPKFAWQHQIVSNALLPPLRLGKKARKRRRKELQEYLDSLTDVDWNSINDFPEEVQ